MSSKVAFQVVTAAAALATGSLAADTGRNFLERQPSKSDRPAYFDSARKVSFHLPGHDDFCLAVDLTQHGSGRDVITWKCSDAFTQRWTYHPLDKTFRQSVNAGWCVVRESNRDSNGARLHLEECSKAGDGKVWEVKDGMVFSRSGNFCVGGGAAQNGVRAFLRAPAEGQCFVKTALGMDSLAADAGQGVTELFNVSKMESGGEHVAASNETNETTEAISLPGAASNETGNEIDETEDAISLPGGWSVSESSCNDTNDTFEFDDYYSDCWSGSAQGKSRFTCLVTMILAWLSIYAAWQQ